MFFHRHFLTHTQRQRGAVLIISLIFLLVLTLIGVSAMQGTTMQERMSANMQDRNVAFQASEAALRAGEDWLQQNEYKEHSTTPRLSNPGQWDGVTPEPSDEHSVSDELYADPVYHIAAPYPIRRYEGDTRSGVCDLYPVVSRAVGRSEVTTVVIQTHSIYCH